MGHPAHNLDHCCCSALIHHCDASPLTLSGRSSACHKPPFLPWPWTFCQHILLSLADTTYTFFYFVWATGYAKDLVPEVPTTVTYNKGNGIPATPADAQSWVWLSTNK